MRIGALCCAVALTCAAPAYANGHPYDPCAVVSKTDVASAFGVAADQIFTPQNPNENECAWAVAAHTGTPGQRAAFTLQTIEQTRHMGGWKLLSAVVGAARQIPGMPITNSAVNQIFDDAQTVANLGDRASWKDRTLSVVKNELLLQVQVSGSETDDAGLKIAESIAQSALDHLPSLSPPVGQPSQAPAQVPQQSPSPVGAAH